MPKATEDDILKSAAEFTEMYGPIITPVTVAQFNDFVARRTGRTTVLIAAMLEALSEHKTIGLLVHRHDHGTEIVRRMQEADPELDKRRIRILSYQSKWQDALRGYRQFPIFVDNAVTDIIATDYVKNYVNGRAWVGHNW